MAQLGGPLPEVDEEDKDKPINPVEGFKTWAGSVGRVSNKLSPDAGEGGLFEAESDYIDKGISNITTSISDRFNQLDSKHQKLLIDGANTVKAAYKYTKENPLDTYILPSAAIHTVEGLGNFWQMSHGLRSAALQFVGVDKGAADKMALGRQLTTGRAFPKVTPQRLGIKQSISKIKTLPEPTVARKLINITDKVDQPIFTGKTNQLLNAQKVVKKPPTPDFNDLRAQSFVVKVAQRQPGMSGTSVAQILNQEGLVHNIFTEGSSTANAVSNLKNLTSPTGQFTKIPKPLVADAAKWPDILANARGTGDKMRNAVAAIFGDGIIIPYQRASRYLSGLKDSGAITNVHHVGFLEKLKHGVINHGSFDLMEEAAQQGRKLTSPVVAEVKKLGLRLGNFDENVADVFSVMTRPFREARKENVFKALDGKLDMDTINQLLGKTGLPEKYLSKAKLAELAMHRDKGWPIPDDFWPKESFPKYTLKDGSWWRPANWQEYEDRFKIHLQKEGIDINVPKTKQLLGKIPRTAEHLGGDHDLVHEIFKKLEADPKSRIAEIDRIIQSPQFKNMDPKKAALLIKEQVNTMETIAGNILEFRYNEIAKLYRQKFLKGELKKFGYNTEDFNLLNEVSKQKFIKRFSNEVAVAGGLDLEKYFADIDKALVPLKKDNLKNLNEAFGFKPQTY